MLKTVEEVGTERQVVLQRIEKKRVQVERTFRLAVKLVESGIPIETNYEGTELLFKGDSAIARKICRTFRVKFVKQPHDDHVDYIGKCDNVKIHIFGAVPPGCKVIYEDVVIPEHTEKRPKIVCNEA